MLQRRHGKRIYKEGGFEMVLLGTVLIICLTVLLAMYMYFCSENEVKMFADPRYDERIKELEKRMKELEGKA